MGASSSFKIYQEFSDALTHIVSTHGNVPTIVSYLDDHLIISDSVQEARDHLESFANIASLINLPLADDKTAGPATILEFLGIELDTMSREARLPETKIKKAVHIIQSLINSKRVHRKKIESAHGYLNYCASIIPAGRAFLRSLAKLLRSESAWVSLSNDVKLDLETWLHFLANFNGKVMFVPSSWDSPDILTLGSDSSGSWGCAAIFLDQYFALPWPKNIPRTNLALLELYPIVIATFMWEQKMTNKRIKIACDNLAVVHIINNLKSHDAIIMKLVRLFTLQCLKNNVWFQAAHIGTRHNLGPDLLSRGRASQFSQIFPTVMEVSKPIPPTLKPENLLVP